METDRHARDHRPRPHRHRGPGDLRLRRAHPVLALAAASGRRHSGLGHAQPAALPPIAGVHPPLRPTVGTAMPAVMGEGLKPLMASQRPSDSSHTKIGTVAITARTGIGWLPRNSAAMAEAISKGAPISPSTGIRRGTRPERYIR